MRGGMIWCCQPVDEETARRLSGSLGVSLPLARLLVRRGYEEEETARRFLSPHPSQLRDPYLMADMKKAVARLGRAISEKEKVFIFGDYDVDGVTSITILSALLDAAGVPYRAYQPNRLKEGYGLSREGVDRALEYGASLLFALDCGTEAGEEIAYARSRGLDVIVIDHHTQRGPLPDAAAILNPNRADCPYPFKGLAAVGVVFKFLHGGLAEWSVPVDWERLYQLAALGTVADVAPLVDENRVLVAAGLHFLESRPDPPLRALLEVSGFTSGRLTAGQLAFQIAPRLNAAGRMGRAELGRQLLAARDRGEMRNLAEQLNRLNDERRSLQAAILDEAGEKIEAEREKYLGSVIVVEGEGWNKGIVGIVAAKLQERYYRPVVVIALEGERGTGSARGIPGFNLFEAVSRCAEYLTAFGGHQAAAGIRIDRERIDDFRKALDRVAGVMLGKESPVPELEIDAEIELEEATIELAGELDRLEPFGHGNPRPVFCSVTKSMAGSPSVMGKKNNHLKIRLLGEGGTWECVGWEMAPRVSDLDSGPIDIAYQIRTDTFRSRPRVQLVLKDFRQSMPVSEFQ
ncbi:MAG: single-stranded-DNA-specific exonuclease RecJ [PVC group bacterium]